MAFHIHSAHVNHTLHPEAGSGCGSGHAVLTSAGFRDDAGFPHSAGEKNLTDRVIDFMRSGMEKVFPLEIDFGAAELLREALRKVEGRRASAKVSQQISQLLAEGRVSSRRVVFLFQILQSGHQRLGDKHPAVGAKVPTGIRQNLFSSRAHG